MAVLFDGTNSFLQKSVADWRGSDTSGTICAVIRRAATGAGHHIFSSADEAGANNYLYFNVNASNVLTLTVYWGVSARGADGSTSLAADTWYHVAAANTGGGSVALYVNGVAESLTPKAGGNDGSWLQSVSGRDNVSIGVMERNTQSGFFNGQIAWVAYYNSALSAAQILNQATGRMKRPSGTLPTALWELEDAAEGVSGDAVTFKDHFGVDHLTGDANGGTLTGQAEARLGYPG